MGILGSSLALALVAASAADKGDLTRLSIDELASLQVETVSRHPESQLEAAGAVHVITEEAEFGGGFEIDRAVRARANVEW